jgi:YVTN family beta-propeller protein
MKLSKLKPTVVLAACLLMAACGSESSCSITEAQLNSGSAIIATYIFSLVSGGPVTPFSQVEAALDAVPASFADSAQLNVWVAEAQSDGPLSMFTLSNGSASSAMPVNILSGVHAGGITSYIGATPQQSALYEWTNSTNATIEVLGDQDGSVITSIPLGTQGVIQDFTVAPNGKLGYATVMGSNKLYFVDLTKNTVANTVTLGTSAEPFASAVAPDSNEIYVADRTNGVFYTVNANTLNVATTLSFGPGTLTFGKAAVTPDGTQLWIPASQAGAVIVDLGSDQVSNYVQGFANTSQIAFSPDGTTAYLLVTPFSGNGAIVSLNTSTLNKNWSAQTGLSPHGLFVSPQGMYLAVANSGDGTISVINAATGATVSTTDVGMMPVGVEINH